MILWWIGLRIGHNLQLRKGVLHFGWTSVGGRDPGDQQKECPQSNRCSGLVTRGMTYFNLIFVWNPYLLLLLFEYLINLKDEVVENALKEFGLYWVQY